MPTHRVPSDSPQKNIIVDIHGDPMNVRVADVRPHQVEGGGAFLSYMIDPDSDEASGATRSDTFPDQYTAILSGKFTLGEMVNSTYAALKLMREAGVTSAIIPLTGYMATRHDLDKEELMTAALLGIREFTDQVRKNALPHEISEIIIAAGSDVFQAWREVKNSGLRVLFGNRPENEEGGQIIPLVQPINQPNDIQRGWLELIGEHLDGLRQSGDGTQSTSSRPKQRHMTVVFDADTGNPIAATDHMSPLKLQGLNPGEAAVDVEYMEINNRAMIVVGRHIVGNTLEPPAEIKELIGGIKAFAPIFPKAQFDAAKPSDAPQPAAPNAELDASNDAVVRTMLEHDSDNSETSANELFVSVAGAIKLATWWSKRSKIPFEALNDMIVERLWSQKRYTFSIDPEGLFAPGIRSNVPSKAVNVEFRTYRDPESGLHKVPVDFKWQGPKGMAFEAFGSWYRSPLFLAARENMVLEDRLTETMFERKGAFARACALMAHLATNKDDYRIVNIEYIKANGMPESFGGIFDKLIKGLMRVAAGKSNMTPKKEVRIAFLEMVMRLKLGDRLVDKILNRTGGGSPQGPGNTPAPSTGTGTPQASGGEPATGATAASSKQTTTAEQVRLEIVTREPLPYSDVGLRDRLRAFVLHLTDNPGQWRKVATTYDTIMVNHESTFHTFFEGLKRRIIVMGHTIDRQAQIDIAFLEIVMRNALGAAPVDGILKNIAFSTGGGKVGDLIRQWREMITNRILDITKGPLKPETPANRFIHLVMVFNPITGEPVYVNESASLPKPDTLEDSRAAIRIDYEQKGYDTSIRVEFDKVVANSPLSDTSRSIITSLKDTLAPLGNTPTPSSGNGGTGNTGAPPSGAASASGGAGASKASGNSETKGDSRQTALRWLDMIRDEIAEVTRRPIHPAMSTRRFIDLSVIFNPSTGEPKSVHKGIRPRIGLDLGDDERILLKFLDDGRRADLWINELTLEVSDFVHEVLRILGEMSSTGSASGSAHAGSGPKSSPVSGTGNGSDADGGKGADTISAAQLGEPYGWQQHMAPPPAREIRGIVREEARPASDEDTVEMELTDDEIAAAMAAAEDDCAINTSVISAETFLMATASIAQA